MKNEYLKSNIELKNRSYIIEFDKEYNHSLNGVKRMFNENPDCTPIFIAIVGSASYGLDLEKSDLDCKGVYIQDLDTIMSELRLGDSVPYGYKQQLGGAKKGTKEKTKEDITLYELGRYLDLIQTNNPNILELLNTPSDCIVYEHPIWLELKNILSTDKILTKKCYYTFHNYAIQQIKKATGLNKKINKPISKNRKTPIDFCYAIDGNKSIPLNKYLDDNRFKQLFCGMVKIPHARDLYAMYYDKSAHNIFNTENETIRNLKKKIKIFLNKPMGLGYKGILKEAKPVSIYDENGNKEEVEAWSNEIRLSSIPKGEIPITIVAYNKDGNLTYNKDYKDYWGKDGWMVKRNEERYADNTKGGQDYDGKNMSHCLRLLFMADEIAEGKGIITMRDEDDRNLLLSIKKGELSYEEIIEMSNKIIYGFNIDNKSLEEKYEKSSLPENVDLSFIKDIALKIRKEYYKIK